MKTAASHLSDSGTAVFCLVLVTCSAVNCQLSIVFLCDELFYNINVHILFCFIDYFDEFICILQDYKKNLQKSLDNLLLMC